MKAEDIKVDGLYSVKLHGTFTVVRVKKVEVKETVKYTGKTFGVTRTFPKKTHYVCLNTTTNREVIIKSAAKFRRVAHPSEVKQKPISFGRSEQRPDPIKSNTSRSRPSAGRSSVTSATAPTRTGVVPQKDVDPSEAETVLEGEQGSDPTSVNMENRGGSASPADEPQAGSATNGDSCSWQPRSEYGYPRFKINDKTYDFRFIQFGIELSYLNDKMEMVKWTVTCSRGSTPISCDCPSDNNGKAVKRCKHVRALKAALSKAPYTLV